MDLEHEGWLHTTLPRENPSIAQPSHQPILLSWARGKQMGSWEADPPPPAPSLLRVKGGLRQKRRGDPRPCEGRL